MRFLVHAAGNEKIGIGHLSRTKSLISALVSVGQQVYVVYEGPSDLIRNFLVPDVDYSLVSERADALAARENFVKSSNSHCNILITDLLGLSKADSEFAKKQGFYKTVHLNDEGVPDYVPDIWINGDAFAQYNRQLPHAIKQLTGAKYHIIQPSVLKYRLVAPWRKSQINKIMVTMGGSDPDFMTEALLDTLADINNCKFTIVIGPAFSPARLDELQKRQSQHCTVITNHFNLPALMIEHDLIITLGGITSYEAMCLGIPVAAITWKYLTPYVEGLAKLQVLTSLGLIKDAGLSLKTLLQSDTEILARQAKNAWKLIDGKGASRIADYLRYLE